MLSPTEDRRFRLRTLLEPEDETRAVCAITPGWQELTLERFSNTRALSSGVQGGFYFHPTDKDSSVGTPERKKPLECVAPVYSNGIVLSIRLLLGQAKKPSRFKTSRA